MKTAKASLSRPDAERLGGLEIDDEIELGRLKHRQIGRLFTLENSPDIDTSLTICVRGIGSVTHQTAAPRQMQFSRTNRLFDHAVTAQQNPGRRNGALSMKKPDTPLRLLTVGRYFFVMAVGVGSGASPLPSMRLSA